MDVRQLNGKRCRTVQFNLQIIWHCSALVRTVLVSQSNTSIEYNGAKRMVQRIERRAVARTMFLTESERNLTRGKICIPRHQNN